MRPSKNQRKLKNIFINHKIQLRLAFTNLTYIFLIISVVVLAILSPFYSDMYRSSNFYAQHLAADIFILLIERLFIALIAIFLLSSIHQIIISHRICGPLINFSKTFEKITHGDLTRKIFLRRHDFLKNEAVQVNEMIDSLSSYFSALKQKHDLLFESLEKLERAGKTQDIFDDPLKEAKHQAQICIEHLSKMKIGNGTGKEETPKLHIQQEA